MKSAIAWLTVLAAAALPSLAETQTQEWSFALSPGGRVSVDNVNGKIEVVSWDRDEIEIVAVKKAKGFNSAERMEQVEIEIEDRPGGVSIRTVYPRGFGRKGSVSVHYELRVPREVDLELEATNGRIFVAKVSGSVAAETTNGRIELEGIEGAIDASTTNGSIRAELLAHNGEDIRCNTTNGSIRLALPSSIQAEIRAGVTNGSISSELPVTLSGKMSRKSLRGGINGGGPLIRLETTNGSISLDASDG